MIDHPHSHAGHVAPERHDIGLSRRAFLGAGVLTAVGLGSLLGASPAVASVATRQTGRVRLAVLSDTHVNPDFAARNEATRLAYAAVANRAPDAVLHCGDITDFGSEAELKLAGDMVPQSLRGRMHYAAGNHEVRWDTYANEILEEHVGAGSYSFDVGGVHVVSHDPTLTLQEPGHVGAAGLEWLREDLASVPAGTPIVVFQHYPIAGPYYYLDDQDALLALLAEYDVRAFLAGHIHRESMTRMNGFTQLTLASVRNRPTYYWLDGDGTRFQVTRVEVAPDGAETETPLLDIPLSGARTGVELRPAQASATPSGDGARLQVRLPAGAKPTRVVATAYGQDNWGGSVQPVWQQLTASGDSFTGTVALPPVPGEARVWLAVESADAAWWQTERLRLPSPQELPAVSWEDQLGNAVQGAVRETGNDRKLAVAATTGGAVVALRPADGRRQWEQELGPVHRGAGGDGDVLFVPSADHTLSALQAANGKVRWRADVGAPVMSEPLLVGGRHGIVIVTAGEDLIALDGKTGSERWRVAGRGHSAGRVASDGEAVYGCATDGYARAHSLADGTELWAFQMRDAPGDTYKRVIYSGWNDRTEVVNGVVLAASVSATWGLDAATGHERWRVAHSAMYASTVVLEDGDVILASELGVILRVDTATGVIRWQVPLSLRVLEGGIVRSGDRVWVQSTGGQLIGLNLADGTEVARLRHTLAYSYSTPVAIDGTVVVGDLDGIVRGIRVS